MTANAAALKALEIAIAEIFRIKVTEVYADQSENIDPAVQTAREAMEVFEAALDKAYSDYSRS